MAYWKWLTASMVRKINYVVLSNKLLHLVKFLLKFNFESYHLPPKGRSLHFYQLCECFRKGMMNSWSKNDKCSGHASCHPQGKFWCKLASFLGKSSFEYPFETVKKGQEMGILPFWLNRKKNDFFSRKLFCQIICVNRWFLSLTRSNVNVQKIVIASSKFLRSCRFIFVFRKRPKSDCIPEKVTMKVPMWTFDSLWHINQCAKRIIEIIRCWAPWNSLGQLIPYNPTTTSKLTVSFNILVSS